MTLATHREIDRCGKRLVQAKYASAYSCKRDGSIVAMDNSNNKCFELYFWIIFFKHSYRYPYPSSMAYASPAIGS